MAVFPILLFLMYLVIVVVNRRSGGHTGAMLTEPRCAKCNYDLRGFNGSAPVRCSECGADLTARHAIIWGA